MSTRYRHASSNTIRQVDPARSQPVAIVFLYADGLRVTIPAIHEADEVAARPILDIARPYLDELAEALKAGRP